MNKLKKTLAILSSCTIFGNMLFHPEFINSLSATAADSVAINSSNFPDSAFRSYVSKNFDHNNNSVLDSNEISLIHSVIIEDTECKSLKGIEYFTELDYLKCNKNNLTSLDISKNTALEKVFCENNNLTELDISQNTALCYESAISSISEGLQSDNINEVISGSNQIIKKNGGDVLYNDFDEFLKFISDDTPRKY